MTGTGLSGMATFKSFDEWLRTWCLEVFGGGVGEREA